MPLATTDVYNVQPLGPMLLSHLRSTTAANAWPEKDFSAIQYFLTNDHSVEDVHEKDNPVEQALRAWIATLPPQDADRITQALPEAPRLFLSVMLPALLAWSCDHDWPRTTLVEESAAIGLNLMKYIGDFGLSNQDHSLAYLAQAKMLSDTIGSVTSSDQARSLFAPWVLSMSNAVWEHGEWPSVENAGNMFFDTWTYLGIAAEKGDAGRLRYDPSASLSSLWKKRLQRAIDKLPAELHVSLCCCFLEKTVSPALTLALFHKVGHDVLVHSDVQMRMKDKLPVQEKDRVPLLPWSHTDGVFNAEMSRAYIPNMATLVDALAPASIWDNWNECRAFIQSIMNAQVGAPVLDIAPTLFEDSPPA